jgi:hypothetical protein
MYVLLIVICPFVLFHLAIMLSVLLRLADSDCPIGILDLRILIAPLVSSNSSFTLFVFPVFLVFSVPDEGYFRSTLNYISTLLLSIQSLLPLCHYVLVLIVVFNKRYRKPKTQSRVDYTEI